MRKQFDRVIDEVIRRLGSPIALLGAAAVVIAWGLTGPVFGFSDSWQLVINTGTTIVTFLMVFVIQNGQNRDAKAVHIKLDELIRAVDGAREQFVLAENQTEEEQDRQIAALAREARKAVRTSSQAAKSAAAAARRAGAGATTARLQSPAASRAKPAGASRAPRSAKPR